MYIAETMKSKFCPTVSLLEVVQKHLSGNMSWFHSALHPSCYELGFLQNPLLWSYSLYTYLVWWPPPQELESPLQGRTMCVSKYIYIYNSIYIYLVGGFNPLKNMLVKMGSSSQFSGWKQKNELPPPKYILCIYIYLYILIYHLGFPGVFFCRHVPKKNGSPGCKKTEVPRHSSTVRRKSPTCWYLEPNRFVERTRSQKVLEKMGDVCLAGKHKKKQLIWVFPKIVDFPPKSSILIGFSIINHPILGTTIFGNTHM